MPRVGTTLVDRYQLEETISEGAMGRIYRAKDTTLGTDVAVKVILGQWLQNAEVRARFEREALASAKIHHPNVVSAIDYGAISETGGAYLVTPLVSGQSLREYLEGPLPLAEAANIASQLCSALRVAHQCGVIHRDLKPENILLEKLDDSLFVRLVDFGIASETEAARAETGQALTQAGMVLGTPGYMAPEQLSGEAARPATDVYALGVLLYEMLLGHPPFNGGLAQLAAQQINHQVDMAPLKHRAPQHVRDLILQSLSPKPEARPTLEAFSEVVECANVDSLDAEQWHALWQGFRSFLTVDKAKVAATLLGVVVVAALLTSFGDELPSELEEPFTTMRTSSAAAQRRRAAQQILAYRPQDELPTHVKAIAAFEMTRSCGARKRELLKLARLEEQSDVAYIYERLDGEKTGCGFLDRSDCHRCLRGELRKILKDAP